MGQVAETDEQKVRQAEVSVSSANQAKEGAKAEVQDAVKDEAYVEETPEAPEVVDTVPAQEDQNTVESIAQEIKPNEATKVATPEKEEAEKSDTGQSWLSNLGRRRVRGRRAD